MNEENINTSTQEEIINPVPKSRKLAWLVGVLVVVVVGVGVYAYKSVFVHPTNTIDTPSGEATSTSKVASWQTYTNDKYGFSFKYPADLAVEALAETSFPNGSIDMLHVYDKNYVAPQGAVGQDVRAGMREVVFTIYPYSAGKYQNLKNTVTGAATITVSNATVHIDAYTPNSVAGSYFQAFLHNDKYILGVYSIGHDALTEQMLSTFQFDNTTSVNTDATLLSPNGGEKFCLGQQVPITWQVGKNEEDVQVDLVQYAGTQRISSAIGTFPATRNETGEKNTGKGTYLWSVGSTRGGVITISPEVAWHYKIDISGIDFEDSSDSSFSITDCRG